MSDVPPYGPPGTAYVPENPLVGVKGWLLFFCIVLTVISPLFNIFNVVRGYNDTSSYFDTIPGLQTAVMTDTILSIVVIAFSIFAGVSLWTRGQNAVKIAKAFLIMVLIYTLLQLPIFLTLADLPSRVREVFLTEAWPVIARGVVFFGIWYSYLSRSKRVAATYGTGAADDHIGLNIGRGAGS